jgi:hypothetical protein
MPITKRHRTVRRLTYKSPKEICVLICKNGNIRSDSDLGFVQLSKIPLDVLFNGCDWKGAYSIYFYLNHAHPAIYYDDEYFFSNPHERKDGNCLILLIFHHLYNIGLINEPWFFPPFRTPIKLKYEYFNNFLKNNELPFNMNETELFSLINDIQNFIRIVKYSCWQDFLNDFLNYEDKKTDTLKVYSARTDEERLKILATNCSNGPEILDFLRSPIDDPNILKNIEYDDCLKDDILDSLCHIVLDKLDQHSIYVQTGVKPLMTNWIEKLDLNIFKK